MITEIPISFVVLGAAGDKWWPLPDPPGSAERVKIDRQVELGKEGPIHKWASYGGLYVPWKNEGGDWLDRNGVKQGAAHFATAAAPTTGNDLTFTGAGFAALIEMLRAENTGFYLRTDKGTTRLSSSSHPSDPGPRLTIVTNTGTFTPPIICDTRIPASGNVKEGSGANLSPPVILKFDLAGIKGKILESSKLELRVNHFFRAVTWFADYLDMPRYYSDFKTELPEAIKQGIAVNVKRDSDLANHPSVLAYREFRHGGHCEWDTQTSGDSGSYIPPATPNPYSFAPWQEYAAQVLRVASRKRGPSLLNVDLQFSPIVVRDWWCGPKPRAYMTDLPNARQEIWCRWCLKLDLDNVTDGAWKGVKLPGPKMTMDVAGSVGGPRKTGRQPGVCQATFTKSLTHRNRFSIGSYYYHEKNWPGTGSGTREEWTPVALKAGVVQCHEIHWVNNTFVNGVPQNDGWYEYFLDGVKIGQVGAPSPGRGYNWTIHPNGGLNQFEFRYGSGTSETSASTPFWFETGMVAVATEYIGPPKRTA